MNDLPFRIDQLDGQRHLAQRVRGAGEAGVEGAEGDFDVVEQAFGDFAAIQVAARDVANAYARHVAGYLVKQRLGASYGELAGMLDAYVQANTFPPPLAEN